MKKKYIATTLNDVASVPGIRHIYENVVADVQARYWRLKGYDVLFNVGCLDNSQDAFLSAENTATKKSEHITNLRLNWSNMMECMNISFSNFVSTVNPSHALSVRTFFKTMVSAAHFKVLSKDDKLCCPWCIEEKLPNAVRTKLSLPAKNALCVLHDYPLEPLKETSINFDINLTYERLGEAYDKHRIIISPKKHADVIQKRFKELKEIVVARKKVGGTKLGEFPHEHLVEWADRCLALWTHSILKGEHYWPLNLVITSEKNLHEMAILLPALMLAADWKVVPERIIVRGKLNKNDETPLLHEMLHIYGSDALRFYMLIRDPRDDFNFNVEDMISYYNHSLNKIGNIVTRISSMMCFFEDATLPQGKAKKFDWVKWSDIQDYERDIENFMYKGAVGAALRIFDKVKQEMDNVNSKLIRGDDTEIAHSISEQDARIKEAAAIIKGFICGIRIATTLLKPFLPYLASRIEKVLKYDSPKSWNYIRYLCEENNTAGMSKAIGYDRPTKRPIPPILCPRISFDIANDLKEYKDKC